MVWFKRVGALAAVFGILAAVGLGLVVLYKEISPIGWWAFGTVETDEQGVAIGGYDAVSYWQGGPQPGLEAYTIEHKGAIWRFATDENRHAFALDRTRYEPAFNGFCGYAVSYGYTAAVDPEIYSIDGGRLVLFADEDVRGLYASESRSALATQAWTAPETE